MKDKPGADKNKPDSTEPSAITFIWAITLWIVINWWENIDKSLEKKVIFIHHKLFIGGTTDSDSAVYVAKLCLSKT